MRSIVLSAFALAVCASSAIASPGTPDQNPVGFVLNGIGSIFSIGQHASQTEIAASPLNIIPPSRGQMVSNEGNYSISVKYTPAAALPGEVFYTNKTRSLAIMIAPNNAVQIQTGALTPSATNVPTGAFLSSVVYSVSYDANTKQQFVVDNRGMKRSPRTAEFFFNSKMAPEGVSLVVVNNWLDDYANSSLSGAISGAATAAPAIAAFAFGGPVAAVGSGVTNATAISTGIISLIQALDRGQNQAIGINLARAGTYNITTSYAKITITIKRIDRVITNPSYRLTVQNTIDANSNTAQKLNPAPASFDSSCGAVDAYLVNQLALTDAQDQVFFLEYIAQSTGVSRSQNLGCLRQNNLVGAAYALPAALKNPHYPVDLTDTLLLGPVDAAKLDRAMYAFTQYFPAYLRLAAPTPAQSNKLQSFFGGGFKLQDLTSTIQLDTTAEDAKSLVVKLQQHGYYHAGCYGLLDATTESLDDGATAAFLIMHADLNANTAPVDSVVAVRVLSGGTTFDQFNIVLDRALVQKLLPPGGVCGNFTVTGITQTAAPGTAAPANATASK